jgi:hypothetical protein
MDAEAAQTLGDVVFLEKPPYFSSGSDMTKQRPLHVDITSSTPVPGSGSKR